MMLISVYSPDDRYDSVYLGNYANLYLLDPIKRIPGANLSSMFPLPRHCHAHLVEAGSHGPVGDHRPGYNQRHPAAEQGLRYRLHRPVAITEGHPANLCCHNQGMLSDPAEFDNIIIRASHDGSAIVRLKDVARAEVGGKDYSISSKVNGKNPWPLWFISSRGQCH